jgi:hypothetical protein
MAAKDKPPLPWYAVLLLASLAWLSLGLLFGGHWWVLYTMVARSPSDRRACLIHFTLHIVALVLTAGGGWYVRSPEAGYAWCSTPDGLLNISMSRDCLWSLQPSRYRIVYVLHFVGGGWLLSAFVLDAVNLPGWTLASRDRPMATFYCTHAPLFPHYTATLCMAVLAVTLTWTIAFPWNDFNLNQLLAVLIGVILAVGAGGSFAIRFARRRIC